MDFELPAVPDFLVVTVAPFFVVKVDLEGDFLLAVSDLLAVVAGFFDLTARLYSFLVSRLFLVNALVDLAALFFS